MKKILPVLAFLLALNFARADNIVFDDFGPKNTYSPTSGNAIGGANSNAVAGGFTALASGNIASVDLGLTFFRQAIAVNVFFYSDAGGLPDNATETLLGTVTPTTPFGSNDLITSLNVGGIVPVEAGTDYWLALKPAGSSDDLDFWNYSSYSGLLAVSFNDSDWFPVFESNSPAFRITAVPSTVPDSGTAAGLLAMGTVGVFLLQRLLGLTLRSKGLDVLLRA